MTRSDMRKVNHSLLLGLGRIADRRPGMALAGYYKTPSKYWWNSNSGELPSVKLTEPKKATSAAKRPLWLMPASGQTEKSGRVTGKSALPSRTDIASSSCQVRKVPKTVVSSCNNSTKPIAGI
jgi:hypothetical protein